MPLGRQCDLDVDRAPGRLRVGVRRCLAKPCGEVAPADLVRGPPQVVERGGALAGPSPEIVLQVQRLLPCEELSAQDRAEGLRINPRAHARSDVFGSGICLLGGDAALLDWEGRPVPGRVDVFRARHAAVVVDRDEPVLVGGKLGDRGALYKGKRNDIAALEAATAWGEEERAVLCLTGVGAGLD